MAEVWPVARFCNSDQRLNFLATVVMRSMNLKEFEGLKGERLAKKEAKWLERNTTHVRTGLNNIRNDVAGQLRLEYVKNAGKPVKHPAQKWQPDWVHAKLTDAHTSAISKNFGKKKAHWVEVPTITNLRPTMELSVPTLQDIQDCIEREPHLMTTAKGHATFDDFVDVWLRKTAGRLNWDDDKRLCETVSKAKREDGKPCIDDGMEAMCFMFFENQHYRHAALALEKLGGEDFGKGQKDTSPWTCSDGGQLQYGGWSTAGQARYKIMREKVRQGRLRPHVEQMEADCLTRLRTKYGLDGTNKAPKAAKSAKRGRCVELVDSDIE